VNINTLCELLLDTLLLILLMMYLHIIFGARKALEADLDSFS